MNKKLGPPMVSGEPLELEIPNNKSVMWNLGCCDCGLYHMFILTRKGNTIVVRAYRDEHMTSLEKARRKKKGRK